MTYVLYLAILLAIYIILTTSLQLAVGQAGVLSLAHGAFFGLGAYVAAAIEAGLTTDFLAVSVGAFLVTASVCALAFRFLLVLPRDQFAIGSLAIHLLFFAVVLNLTSLTGGPLGISGINRPTLLGFHVSTMGMFALLCVSSALLSAILVARSISSPLGLALRGVREDPILMKALGRNVPSLQLKAVFLSAGLAGFAGALYAEYFQFIDPTSFSINISIVLLTMLLLGGLGPMKGAAVGACVGVLVPEILRNVSLTAAHAANIRSMLFGLAMIALLYWRPQGLLGDYRLD